MSKKWVTHNMDSLNMKEEGSLETHQTSRKRGHLGHTEEEA